MRTILRLLVAALAVTSGLGLLAGAAQANRSLSVGVTRGITETSRGAVTFEEPSGSFGLACTMTLNGTLERAFAKRAGTHVGSLTEGRTSECRDTFFGSAGAAVWLMGPLEIANVVYNSFLGTLPRINGLLYRSDARVLLRSIIGECLYETAGNREFSFLYEIEANGGVVGKRILREAIRLLRRLSGTCPASIFAAGQFNVPAGIVVRLL